MEPAILSAVSSAVEHCTGTMALTRDELFRPGDLAEAIFFVVSGSIHLKDRVDRSDEAGSAKKEAQVLASLCADTWFGEEDLLARLDDSTAAKRVCSAQAAETTVLLKMPASSYRACMVSSVGQSVSSHGSCAAPPLCRLELSAPRHASPLTELLLPKPAARAPSVRQNLRPK